MKNKNETIRERFTISKIHYELLQNEANKQGKTISEMLNHILYESLVKPDNRLSNHIARTNENFLIMLLRNGNKQYSSIEEIFHDSYKINSEKKKNLKELRDKKYTKINSFWKDILKSVNLEEWKKIKKTEDAIKKIKEIHSILVNHKDFLNE